MTDAEEGVLRGLLRGRPLVYPFMVFGMLGGDPNDVTTEELGRISGWLHQLGYRRQVCPRFNSAYMMSVWVREEVWPGETPECRRPYSGILLEVDPELAESRAERAERDRRWHRLLSQF